MQRCQIMNKLISVNYWFGCDWWFCEVGYLSLHAGQLSLTCAVVYLWNTGYIRATRPRIKTGIQYIDDWKRFRNLAKRDKALTIAVMQTNTCLVTSSPDHRRKPLSLTKRTTTPSGLMQPEMKWIESRNKRSSPHAKASNGILTIKILNAPPNHQMIRVNLIFAVM